MWPGRGSGLIALSAVCASVAFGAGSAWAAFPLAKNGNIKGQAGKDYGGKGCEKGKL
jgi:hypothetical protein